ncbi:MAG: porphobilinogen synthase [Nitrososphaerota archaeon]|jgi:porphobilinogen synthase|nr:porphobilinogen synthase [Nitrososphaerota archaeon]
MQIERVQNKKNIQRRSSVQQPRRLRATAELRNLVSETEVEIGHLVMPIFVQEGSGLKQKIQSMPGIYRYSPDKELDKEIEELTRVGISSVLLFGLPKKKDSVGSGAYDPDGVVQQAVRRIKNLDEDVIVICDVCMCEYTDHGHCGILNHKGVVQNEKTISYLGRIAEEQAKAGADIVAPSAMMDDQVGSIRTALDADGFESVPIMSYSSKFASAFYGPFREAVDSAPQFGDRKSYQMDWRNIREALRETQLDVDQGADILMVKPALPYLDVIGAVRQRFAQPIAAYNVSGEYSMIKAAAMNGWIDEDKVVDEVLHSIRRAGADIIITYFAKQYASKLR